MSPVDKVAMLRSLARRVESGDAEGARAQALIWAGRLDVSDLADLPAGLVGDWLREGVLMRGRKAAAKPWVPAPGCVAAAYSVGKD